MGERHTYMKSDTVLSLTEALQGWVGTDNEHMYIPYSMEALAACHIMAAIMVIIYEMGQMWWEHHATFGTRSNDTGIVSYYLDARNNYNAPDHVTPSISGLTTKLRQDMLTSKECRKFLDEIFVDNVTDESLDHQLECLEAVRESFVEQGGIKTAQTIGTWIRFVTIRIRKRDEQEDTTKQPSTPPRDHPDSKTATQDNTMIPPNPKSTSRATYDPYSAPVPPGMLLPDVLFPNLTPPTDVATATHLTGAYRRQLSQGNRIGKPVWTNYFRPVKFEELPLNLKNTMKDPTLRMLHWGGREATINGVHIRFPNDGSKYEIVPPTPQAQKNTPSPSPAPFQPDLSSIPSGHSNSQHDVSSSPSQGSSQQDRRPRPPTNIGSGPLGGNTPTHSNLTGLSQGLLDPTTQQVQTPSTQQTVDNSTGSAYKPYLQSIPGANGWELPPPGWKPGKHTNPPNYTGFTGNSNGPSGHTFNQAPQHSYVPGNTTGGGFGGRGFGGFNPAPAPSHNFGAGFGSGSGGFPNPPQPPSGGSGGPGGPPTGGYVFPTPTRSLKPLVKPDAKAYKSLKDIASFDKWYKDTIAHARSHCIEEVFDPSYSPDITDPDDMWEFRSKQTFVYAVLRDTIRVPELRQYVEKYSGNSNAQQALAEILFHIRNSTHAAISTRDMMTEINTARLNMQSWNRPVYEYIVSFDALMDLYNQQQPRVELQINDFMKRQYLQNALSTSDKFQDVSSRETDRIVMGGTPFTWSEYLTAVKSTATLVDERRSRRPKRDVNVAELGNDPEPDSGNLDDAIMQYDINVANRRDPSQYAAQMNKATWNSLSKEAQEKWDTFSAADKAKILTYSKDRDQRRQASESGTTKTHVHFHDVDTADDTPAADPPPEDSPADQTIDVNNVLHKARREAHAGDPRRVLGSDKKSHLTAMMHRLYYDNDADDSDSDSDVFDSYWKGQDFYQGGR
jgi:hypothetical protein